MRTGFVSPVKINSIICLYVNFISVLKVRNNNYFTDFHLKREEITEIMCKREK